MGKNRTIIFIIAAVLIAFLYWYFFVDTLKLSQITGKPSNPYASIFVNIIDIDTGLTRYDIYNLSNKSAYWQRRINEVTAIQDPQRKDFGNAKLLAEMMEDPSIKKIMNKITGIGSDAVFSILQAIK